MKINPNDIEYIKEYKKKLRNTKVKGKRLFYLVDLADMNAATEKQLKELAELKKEIPDWELEADYYRAMYGYNDARDTRQLIDYIYGHHY